jgi:mono/diheme cytochrome c family protein
MNQRSAFSWAFVILLAGVVIPRADAGDGEVLLTGKCAGCHNLAGPAPTTLEALWDRKGPDLFYAGNKYKADWMTRWLQKPQRIRPAGMYYGRHIRSTPDGDEIDASTLTDHPALSAADAAAVTAALMRRKARSDLIHAGEYHAGNISLTMGEMMFDKFKGCLACHRIEPDYGGLSGPEVYTAAERLQDDYMMSYMRNPQAWDPRIFMPNKQLSDRDLGKFVDYMHALSATGGE